MSGTPGLPHESNSSRGRPSTSTRSYRLEKHRLAQQKYRQKKEQRIADLEHQVELLEQRAAGAEPCIHCPIESQRLQQAEALLKQLQDTVSRLEEYKATLTGRRLSTSSTGLNARSGWPNEVGQSRDAVEIEIRSGPSIPYAASNTVLSSSSSQSLSSMPYYPIPPPSVPAPIPDIEVMRAALKTLPSLQNSPLVDELAQLRADLDSITNENEKREQVLKLVATKHKMLDICTILERKRIIEIVEWYRSKNRVEMTLTDQPPVFGPVTYKSKAAEEARDAFRDSLKAIDSLRNVENLIEQLADGFWTWEGRDHLNTSPQEAKELAFKLTEAQRVLARMCVGDDLTKFLMAIEVVRATHQQKALVEMELDYPDRKRSRETPAAGVDDPYDSHSDHEHLDPITGEKQRKKPGRKQVNTKPPDKRTAQNRIAQRAFRERKQNYVKELEQKCEELTAIISGNPALTSATELRTLQQRVTELEQENELLKQNSFAFDFKAGSNSPSNPSPQQAECLNCSIEKMKTVELLNRNKVMELRIMELQYECGNLRMSLQLYEQMNAFVTSPLAPGAFGFGQSPLNMPLPVASFQSVPISSVAPAVNSLKQPTNMEDANRSSSTTTQAASTVSEMDFGLAQATASPQSDDWYDVAKNEKLVPAVDLFGPVQVESQRFALKHLPSIANSKYVDELMDILIALSKCSSRKAHKKLMIRMAAVKHKLMDISNILDRQRVLEIFEEFKSKHPKHINHFYQNMLIGRPEIPSNQPLSEVQNDVLTTLKPFKETVKAIPSLRSASDLIDDLCFQFSAQSLTSDPVEKEHTYVYLMSVLGQIQGMCQTDEDRTKLMLALEVARERTRKFSDQFAHEESKIQ